VIGAVLPVDDVGRRVVTDKSVLGAVGDAGADHDVRHDLGGAVAGRIEIARDAGSADRIARILAFHLGGPVEFGNQVIDIRHHHGRAAHREELFASRLVVDAVDRRLGVVAFDHAEDKGGDVVRL